MKKSLLKASLALCTIGGAVLGLGLAKDYFSKLISLPDWSFLVLVIVGSALILIGLMDFVLSFIAEPVRTIIIERVYGDDSRYVREYARSSDIPGLHALYSKYFGSDVPPVDLMRSWVARCTSAFTLVHRVSQTSGLTTKSELVGSFKVLPLTSEAVRTVDAGQVTGSSFKADHIAETKTEVAAYYVGDVVAKSWFARGAVMTYLALACEVPLRRQLPIYARPLTEDGRRVMTKYGFVQVMDGKSPPDIGRLCKLEIANTSLSPKRSTLKRLQNGRSTGISQGKKSDKKRNDSEISA